MSINFKVVKLIYWNQDQMTTTKDFLIGHLIRYTRGEKNQMGHELLP